MKPEKENVSLTPVEQALKGDKEDKNVIEAALSAASHHFLDEENEVIRTGGRLANSPYTIDRKFSVLIRRKTPITEMLIREAHKQNLHGRPQLTLLTLPRTIWIPGGLFVVQSVFYRCKLCIRFDAKLLQLQIGNLPREQIVPSCAFNLWGLDHC